MTGAGAPGFGPASPSPAGRFRCKVLKPPRAVAAPHLRIVTHPPIDVVAAVIRRDDGRLLITQRMPGDTLGGYWEFPGGKVDPGEALPRRARARATRGARR
ncbi:MAG: NUDIX domain-containing protein [Verrucomicrobiota bacterium]